MKKRVFASLLAAMMAMSVMASCGDGGNESSTASNGGGTTSDDGGNASVDLPNDESVKTFRIACNAAGDVNPPMNEWWIWEEYESMTGIHIDWEEIPGTAVEEKKNLMMTTSDKPDAFWQIGFSVDDLIRYGSQGSFVNLVPYMDQYAPNLKSLLESIDGGIAACTMPDGGIYSMPWVMTDMVQANLRYWINKNWLEAAGLEVPTTIDELTAALDAFKTQDVNGNGDPNDEYPIYMPGIVGMLEQQLCGSYDIGDNGLKPIGEWYYVDDNDQVQFLYTSEGMKEIWQLFADWWSKGYFHPETFGTQEYEKWVTDGSVNDVVGLYSWVGSNYLYNDAYNDFAAIHVLQAEGHDTPVISWCDYPVRGVSAFTITDACKAPGTLLQWADYFYGEEGVEFSAFGKEGVTYDLDDEGNIRYNDTIMDYEGGPQLGAFQYGLFVYGGGLPTWCVDSVPMEIARWQDDPDYNGETFSKFVAESEEYAPEFIPGLIPTLEESAELPAITTDLGSYFAEARTNFVTGAWNFESDWDSYVAQCEKMGSTRYIEIKQAQYDRYKAANAE